MKNDVEKLPDYKSNCKKCKRKGFVAGSQDGWERFPKRDRLCQTVVGIFCLDCINEE